MDRVGNSGLSATNITELARTHAQVVALYPDAAKKELEQENRSLSRRKPLMSSE